jgi:hypothetical protein
MKKQPLPQIKDGRRGDAQLVLPPVVTTLICMLINQGRDQPSAS